MKREEVCAIDEEKGPLIVMVAIGAPQVRLALRRRRKLLTRAPTWDSELLYVTYNRTTERDAQGRPIYR